MLSNEENETMTRVGPETAAGEMLRRYWWPVAFSEEVRSKGAPVKVRLLGEDFVLFRDGSGESLGCWSSTVPIAALRSNSDASKITASGAATTAGFMTDAANV